jgi:hypothetical protein
MDLATAQSILASLMKLSALSLIVLPSIQIEAVDGIVTCPLHGLRIDVATGLCLGSAFAARAA